LLRCVLLEQTLLRLLQLLLILLSSKSYKTKYFTCLILWMMAGFIL
jgi:hypothetical protein